MLTAVDVIGEAGDLDASAVFPGLTVPQATKKVQGMLGQSYAKAGIDGITGDKLDPAARAYTKYQAWKFRLGQMASLPAQVNVLDEGSSDSTDLQRTMVQQFMQDALDEYQGIAAGEETTGSFRTVESLR